MVTKKKSTGEKEEKKSRVKVGKLKLNKETVKDLTGSEKKQIRGGLANNSGWVGCSRGTACQPPETDECVARKG